MTIHWFIIACMAFMIAVGIARRQPGEALANMVVLVFAFAAIGLTDLVASQFVHTSDVAVTIAAFLAFGYALDALYGLMAPQRKRVRDRKLRAFFRGMHA